MDKYQWLPKYKLAAILLWGATSLPRASVKDGTQDVPGNAGFRCRTESLRGHASECLHSLLLC